MAVETLASFDEQRNTFLSPYPDGGCFECGDSQDHDNHAQMRARRRSSWEQTSSSRQNTHPQRPLVSYRQRHDKNGLKRKFSECSASMEPVPEEDLGPEFDDDSSDRSSITTTSSSSSDSAESDTDLTTPDLADGTASQASSAPIRPLSLHHEPERQVAVEVEYVKHLHMQDKAFFQKELRNLRMLLFEAESNLQHRTEELEFILQEREAERWDWEQKRAEWEQEKEREKEELRRRNKELEEKLESRRKEMGKVMSILEGAHREFLQGSPDSPTPGGASDENPSNDATVTRKTTLTMGLARYATIPARVTSLRKQIDESEQRFQTAYNAWSSENKYLRQKHQQQLKAAHDDVQKMKEENRRLGSENKSLKKRVNELKENVSQLKRDSQISISSARRLSNEFRSPSPDSPSNQRTSQDKISIDEALNQVQKLNARIADTAAILAKNLALAKTSDNLSASSSHDDASNREATSLLGGEAVTSQLTFLPAPSKTKDNIALRTLLQVALTNWSASHIHAWDLDPSSRSDSNSLAVIYRKLKVVEDPSVVATWRSLARAQIRFSSSAWSRRLISSIHGVLSFLGLTYTQPVTAMAKDLQPLLSSIRSVREALGELVVSKDLEVVTVKPGTRFDFKQMKGVHPAGSLSPSQPMREPERVVATCGLGVKVTDGPGQEGGRLLALPQIICKQTLCDMLSSLV